MSPVPLSPHSLSWLWSPSSEGQAGSATLLKYVPQDSLSPLLATSMLQQGELSWQLASLLTPLVSPLPAGSSPSSLAWHWGSFTVFPYLTVHLVSIPFSVFKMSTEASYTYRKLQYHINFDEFSPNEPTHVNKHTDLESNMARTRETCPHPPTRITVILTSTTTL